MNAVTSDIPKSISAWSYVRVPQNEQELVAQQQALSVLVQRELDKKRWYDMQQMISELMQTAFAGHYNGVLKTYWVCRALDQCVQYMEQNGAQHWGIVDRQGNKVVQNAKQPQYYDYALSEHLSSTIKLMAQTLQESHETFEQIFVTVGAPRLDPKGATAPVVGVGYLEDKKAFKQCVYQALQEHLECAQWDPQKTPLDQVDVHTLRALMQRAKEPQKSGCYEPKQPVSIRWDNLSDPIYAPYWTTQQVQKLSKLLSVMGLTERVCQYAYLSALSSWELRTPQGRTHVKGMSLWLPMMGLSPTKVLSLPPPYAMVSVPVGVDPMHVVSSQKELLDLLRQWYEDGYCEPLTVGTKGKPSSVLSPVQWIAQCVKQWSTQVRTGVGVQRASERLVHDLQLIGLEHLQQKTMRGKPYGMHVWLSLRQNGHQGVEGIQMLNAAGVVWSSKAIRHMSDTLLYEWNNNYNLRYDDKRAYEGLCQMLDHIQALHDQSPDGIGSASSWRNLIVRWLDQAESMRTDSIRQQYVQRLVDWLVHSNVDVLALTQMIPAQKWQLLAPLVALTQKAHLEKVIGGQAQMIEPKPVRLRL